MVGFKICGRRAVLDVIEHFPQIKRGKFPETRKSLEIIKAIDVTDLLIFKENIKKWNFTYSFKKRKEKSIQIILVFLATENGVIFH